MPDAVLVTVDFDVRSILAYIGLLSSDWENDPMWFDLDEWLDCELYVYSVSDVVSIADF